MARIGKNTIDLQRPNGCRIRYVRYTNPRYFQVHYYDQNNHILWWFDSKEEYQEFRHTIIGTKKNGEPEWQCDIINSTVHWIINETNRQKDWKSDEVTNLNKQNLDRYFSIFSRIPNEQA